MKADGGDVEGYMYRKVESTNRKRNIHEQKHTLPFPPCETRQTTEFAKTKLTTQINGCAFTLLHMERYWDVGNDATSSIKMQKKPWRTKYILDREKQKKVTYPKKPETLL
eukprot:GEMP01122166.1.p1 GENE.GEMP01122166.1~~GEMP01122166.1.p1  ORF type:complete len:119 (-),score=3.63 GEMP01122166.1:238-567(-)